MERSDIVPRVPGISAVIKLVLDGLTSPKSKAVYSTALYRFFDWRERVGNPPFSKRMVQQYRSELLESDLAPSTINLHLCAIRKLALEAGDNGYLDPNVAAAISRVPSVSQPGHKVGQWLTQEEAEALLSQPDISTLSGLRDRAILAVMLGGALRRAEVVSLTTGHFRLVEGRWIIADLVGKGNRVRTVPIPAWTMEAVDAWLEAAGIESGFVFRRIRRGDHLTEETLTDRGLYVVITRYSDAAPHDLRRTWAKLVHKGGAPLDQISLSLGHSSLATTERYLGLEQDLNDAPCDYLELGGK